MQSYSAIGLMSGTSLDGVDIAHCTFTENEDRWNFKIHEAITIPYNKEWKALLANAHAGTALEISQLNVTYGSYLGQLVHDFIKENDIETQLVGSHGHTIFHTPHTGLTLQIGSGAHVAAMCKLPVVSDFRTLDVALGGQGAPLVPMGDRLLFGEYDYCLNLGGIANISFEKNGHRVAFDICPANMALNYLANKAGLEYDEEGKLAQSGMVNEALLIALNALSFYVQPHPKSLGREWFEQEFKPLLDKHAISIADKLATICQHIGMIIAHSMEKGANKNETMLITGGGVFNRHLMNEIAEYAQVKAVIPNVKIINYKEALVFAFLGVLRMLEKPNILASVTGANVDAMGGTVCWI